MANKLILVITGVCLLIIMCTTKQPVTHDFPAEMAAPIKAEYIKVWNKGKILYEINCAKCHNKTVKGREIIPDFQPAQLKGYELRVANAKHESSLPEENVTPEELGHIMTFLSYKKKNR